jgi:hypothetical protein
MAVINFKEIPQANIANGEQDIFELFAREFFDSLGFFVIQDPDRGQDGGRDLIVSEKRTGIIGESDIRWLVSCKHKAHSGSAVNVSDEEDISDRLQAHKCDGFIGFYSTILSAPLNRKLEALKDRYEVQLFDREKIERVLLENNSANKLVKRFFPKSYREIELKAPTNLLAEYYPLRCKVCGKDLLQRDILDNYRGIVVFVGDLQYCEEEGWKHKYMDVYCVCKGECDRKMETVARSQGYVTSWNDISDLVIPIEFLKFIIAIMNRLRSLDDIYTDKAYGNLEEIIIALAQITMKRQSERDIRRSMALGELPEGI